MAEQTQHEEGSPFFSAFGGMHTAMEGMEALEAAETGVSVGGSALELAEEVSPLQMASTALAPLTAINGIREAKEGFAKGGPDGTVSGIAGIVETGSAIAPILGPLALGMKAGQALDHAFGISDGLVNTLGVNNMPEGVHETKRGEVAGDINGMVLRGTNNQVSIHNNVKKEQEAHSLGHLIRSAAPFAHYGE